LYPEFSNYLGNGDNTRNLELNIVSRNYSLSPEETIRIIIENSGVDPTIFRMIRAIPPKKKKTRVLREMVSEWGKNVVAFDDEVSGFKSIRKAGITNYRIATYGFDSRLRLIGKGVESTRLVSSPEEVCHYLEEIANQVETEKWSRMSFSSV
jgi:hypothetical protein